MSFDVFVQDLPKDIATIYDIRRDFRPGPIGSRADIIGGILRAAPHTDFTDPTWGQIEGPNFSIEVSIRLEDPLKSFAFHIRGDSEAFCIVANILHELGLQALAPGTESGLFRLEELDIAYSTWQDYRRQILDA